MAGLIGCAVRTAPTEMSQVEYVPQALQDDLRTYIDLIFGLLPQLQASGPGLLGEITEIFSAILAGGGGVCPTATVYPPITGLNLPSQITLTADYGAGCVTTSGANMSGSLVVTVSNIAQTFSGLSANFVITINNLARDGMVLGNGVITGSVSLGQAAGGQLLQLTISTNGFQASQYATISGTVFLEGVGEIGLSGATFDTFTVSIDNFTVAYNAFLISGAYTIFNGAVTTQRQGASEIFIVDVNLNTSSGPITANAIVDSTTSQSIISTTSTAVINNYTVDITSLVLDANACIYPLGGTIVVTRGGETAVVSFPPTCTGTYSIF